MQVPRTGSHAHLCVFRVQAPPRPRPLFLEATRGPQPFRGNFLIWRTRRWACENRRLIAVAVGLRTVLLSSEIHAAARVSHHTDCHKGLARQFCSMAGLVKEKKNSWCSFGFRVTFSCSPEALATPLFGYVVSAPFATLKIRPIRASLLNFQIPRQKDSF